MALAPRVPPWPEVPSHIRGNRPSTLRVVAPCAAGEKPGYAGKIPVVSFRAILLYHRAVYPENSTVVASALEQVVVPAVSDTVICQKYKNTDGAGINNSD